MSFPLASHCSPSLQQVCQQRKFSSRSCNSPVFWRWSGQWHELLWEGRLPEKGFSHIYELIFCWVFLSLLPLPSVLSKSWPSPHPTRSLAFLNPHAQSLCLHSSSSRPPLPYWALSLFQACGCVLSHSWTPLTSHSVLQHHSQVHLVVPFETPLNLTCQVLADILTTCSNELQLAIVIADEHTLSVEVLLSASSDRWF